MSLINAPSKGLYVCWLHSYIKVRKITTADVLDLEEEILSVFAPDAILTPDKLRGDANSLKEALTAEGSRYAALCAAPSAVSLVVGEWCRNCAIVVHVTVWLLFSSESLLVTFINREQIGLGRSG